MNHSNHKELDTFANVVSGFLNLLVTMHVTERPNAKTIRRAWMCEAINDKATFKCLEYFTKRILHLKVRNGAPESRLCVTDWLVVIAGREWNCMYVMCSRLSCLLYTLRLLFVSRFVEYVLPIPNDPLQNTHTDDHTNTHCIYILYINPGYQ